jgi:radical SAM superfamily enzyme YgiQ (UPF0313 family)
MPIIALLNLETGSYGQRLVSAALKREGFEVHNVFVGGTIVQDGWRVTETELRGLVALLKEIKPDVIGFSILTMFDHANAATITETVKKSLGVPLVWGGVYPSLLPRFCLQRVDIDAVFIGECSDALMQMFSLLAEGKSPKDLPGVMVRETMEYKKGIPPADLDALPFQDVGDFNMYSVMSDATVRKGDPMLNELFIHGHNVYSSRTSMGCPFSCTFCNTKEYRQLFERGGYNRRQRSVANVIEELRNYIKINPKCYYVIFNDEVFPFNRKWVEEFCVEYKRHVGLPFTAWFHPINLKEENLDILVPAGLKKIIMGVQSASEATRKNVYHRHETNEQVHKALDMLAKYEDIEVIVDFILQHPWESPTELEELFEFVMKSKKPFLLGMHNLVLFPSSSLAGRAIAEGLANEEGISEQIIANPYMTSRGFQWVRGIPAQTDLKRAFWLFLTMCAANPNIPRRLIRGLADSSFLRSHPDMLVDRDIVDMRNQANFAAHLQGMFGQSGVRRALYRLPFIENSIDRISENQESFLAYFKLFIGYRLARRAPGALLKTLLRS